MKKVSNHIKLITSIGASSMLMGMYHQGTEIYADTPNLTSDLPLTETLAKTQSNASTLKEKIEKNYPVEVTIETHTVLASAYEDTVKTLNDNYNKKYQNIKNEKVEYDQHIQAIQLENKKIIEQNNKIVEKYNKDKAAEKEKYDIALEDYENKKQQYDEYLKKVQAISKDNKNEKERFSAILKEWENRTNIEITGEVNKNSPGNYDYYKDLIFEVNPKLVLEEKPTKQLQSNIGWQKNTSIEEVTNGNIKIDKPYAADRTDKGYYMERYHKFSNYKVGSNFNIKNVGKTIDNQNVNLKVTITDVGEVEGALKEDKQPVTEQKFYMYSAGDKYNTMVLFLQNHTKLGFQFDYMTDDNQPMDVLTSQIMTDIDFGQAVDFTYTDGEGLVFVPKESNLETTKNEEKILDEKNKVENKEIIKVEDHLLAEYSDESSIPKGSFVLAGHGTGMKMTFYSDKQTIRTTRNNYWNDYEMLNLINDSKLSGDDQLSGAPWDRVSYDKSLRIHPKDETKRLGIGGSKFTLFGKGINVNYPQQNPLKKLPKAPILDQEPTYSEPLYPLLTPTKSIIEYQGKRKITLHKPEIVDIAESVIPIPLQKDLELLDFTITIPEHKPEKLEDVPNSNPSDLLIDVPTVQNNSLLDILSISTHQNAFDLNFDTMTEEIGGHISGIVDEQFGTEPIIYFEYGQPLPLINGSNNGETTIEDTTPLYLIFDSRVLGSSGNDTIIEENNLIDLVMDKSISGSNQEDEFVIENNLVEFEINNTLSGFNQGDTFVIENNLVEFEMNNTLFGFNQEDIFVIENHLIDLEMDNTISGSNQSDEFVIENSSMESERNKKDDQSSQSNIPTNMTEKQLPATGESHEGIYRLFGLFSFVFGSIILNIKKRK